MPRQTSVEIRSLPTPTMAKELQRAFDFFNDRLFLGTLEDCLITLQRERDTLGYFRRTRYIHCDGRAFAHEIALNPGYFAVQTLKATLSVLVHEQVHLWQHLFGKPGRRGYHNTEWAARMESVGLMPSHTSEPGGLRTGENMGHYVIDGGHFDKAADELIHEEHFALSWIDRHPTAVPLGMQLSSNYQPPTDDEVEKRILGFTGRSAAEKPNRVTESMAAEPVLSPARVSELIDQPDARDIPEAAYRPAASSIAWPKDATTRQTRTKYKCTGCEVRVWGRPNLDIRCGDCGGRQFEVETDVRAYGARR